MENGGQEFIFIFEGKKNPVNGLEIRLYQQIFPNMTLIRERLELHTSSNRAYRLNKLNKRFHFKFPQYSLQYGNIGKVTEIRLATWANELIQIDPHATYDERFFKNAEDAHNLANCYMYHPQINEYQLTENKSLLTKGPIDLIHLDGFGWISTYEHASQDNLKGLVKVSKRDDDNLLRDGLQGITGTFNFKASDSDFHFLGFSHHLMYKNIDVSVDILRGGYLDGEVIDKSHPYSSVWCGSGLYPGSEPEKGLEILRDYLWRCICERPASRQPEFYYNTWGMQRKLSSQGEDIRGLFTEKKILQEIEYAAELGIDIFVLDDGWQQAHGIWTPHPQRLPNGLAPIKAALDKQGVKL
ncbi:alpha-galactosidase, partial [candidate division KSB1 bacterium]|nr:alpha-galactosidase [candidate division KSB1 bacterium]